MYDSKYFNNVNKYIVSGDKVSYTGILVASKFSQKNGQDYPLIDLVDIDFNGAWISSLNAYLNEAYDLVYVLDTLNKSSEVGAISKEIERIWEQLDEITSTYITYSSLDEVLQESWQRKLEAGTYISIDTETNPEAYSISVIGLPTFDYLEETYTSLNEFGEYKNHIFQNYYDKTSTYNVAYNAAYDAILRVIDGADNAFDTLKEISDWIISQNRYVEVPWETVANDWKEGFYFKEVLDKEGNPTGKYEVVTTNEETFEADLSIQEATNIEWIKSNWQDGYYFYLEDGKYVAVSSPDSLVEGNTYYYCDAKYYVEENYLTDIQHLIERVNRLDDTVGFKEYNERTDTYTYSGHCKDIYDLQIADAEQANEIFQIHERVTGIAEKADNAYSMAYNAYSLAYTAYNIAYTAIETSYESLGIAQSSYDLAYEAIEKVGYPTVEKHYENFDEYDKELIEEYINSGYKVVYFDENGNAWLAELPLPESTTYQYAYEVAKVEGTGLTARVEDVEKLASDAYANADAALEASYDALYHLMVNNDNSTYVSLSLHPESYFGDRNRTLYVTTQEASINSKDGTILSDGLVNISTAFDIYTYASSWMMLYVDQDVNFEDASE